MTPLMDGRSKQMEQLSSYSSGLGLEISSDFLFTPKFSVLTGCTCELSSFNKSAHSPVNNSVFADLGDFEIIFKE